MCKYEYGKQTPAYYKTSKILLNSLSYVKQIMNKLKVQFK